ncbi:MAG: hypothetical protein SFW62_07705 [Alphaproteobacteria bacterium]|nr:hypothetical protein [Alphaproteobacteria bacterium]
MGILDHWVNNEWEDERRQQEADGYKSFFELKLEGDPFWQAQQEEQRRLWMSAGERKAEGDPYWNWEPLKEPKRPDDEVSAPQASSEPKVK